MEVIILQIVRVRVFVFWGFDVWKQTGVTSDFLLSREAELEKRTLIALDGSHRTRVSLDVGLLNDTDIYINNDFHILLFCPGYGWMPANPHCPLEGSALAYRGNEDGKHEKNVSLLLMLLLMYLPLSDSVAQVQSQGDIRRAWLKNQTRPYAGEEIHVQHILSSNIDYILRSRHVMWLQSSYVTMPVNYRSMLSLYGHYNGNFRYFLWCKIRISLL